MIAVKLVGGAKKLFQTDALEIDRDEITVGELFVELGRMGPGDSAVLDSGNSLVAVNGVDSSAIDGRDTVIRDGDTVSVIPIVHGGAPKRVRFEVWGRNVQALQVRGGRQIDTRFLEQLRKKYPALHLQAVYSRFVLDRHHLQSIVSLSVYSKKRGVLLSKKLETDLLMRFAITGQISEAIESAGIRPGRNFVLIAIGRSRSLNLLYEELRQSLDVPFSGDNARFLKRHFKIGKRHLDSVDSKTPLADVLAEKAAVL